VLNVWASFKNNKYSTVSTLVGAGLQEGVSLAGDLGHGSIPRGTNRDW